MASDSYHEPYDLLSPPTREKHRAVATLIEELEAVDWYQQRADACGDDDLRAVILHNKNEEIEHAMMTLEWLRRNDPVFDAHLRTYLFTDAPITLVEKATDAPSAPAEAGEGPSNTRSPPAPEAPRRGAGGPPQGLGIGSLKEG